MEHKIVKRMGVFVILLLFLLGATGITVSAVEAKNKNKYSIVVEINEQKLYLIEENTQKIVKTYFIASGKPSTPSPVGTWKVLNKGQWDKWFGGRWIGLSVPWGQYGIHGTDRPQSIGNEASHGCIRMYNKDVEELYHYVKYGTVVIVHKNIYEVFLNRGKSIGPGDRGSDVYEIQKLMASKGYYSGAIDGIYGEGMKQSVIKFRKDHGLSVQHEIDIKFIKAIGMNYFE